MNFIPKDLETIFLEHQIITQDQLNEYKKLEPSKQVDLLAYALDVLKIEQDKIAEAFSKSLSVSLVKNIEEEEIDVSLLGRITIKFLRDNIILPYIPNRKLTLLVANPCNIEVLDEIRLVFGNYTIAVASKNLIDEAIGRYYPFEGSKKVMEELEADGEGAQTIDFNTISEEDALGIAQEAPVIKLVNSILFQAVKRGASDIHIEPFEKDLRIRYRIDGSLYIIMNPPKRIQSALSSRLKIMAQLNIAEKRQPQDGRMQIGVGGKAFDIRVSILPVAHGERVVMRLLDKTKSFVAIEDLGLSDRDILVVKDAITQPNGIILVTGPTGSGKTSTLYAVLFRLNTPDACIVTVEDPVEYQMMGVGQVQVREKIGLTFAAALRSILRQDPDVVMIGETRDQETARIAIQAALTGHLVLSTLHTNSACSSITRLIDMNIEPFLIASSVTAIIAQRLVRRLCDNCKVTYQPTPEELRRLPNSGEILKGKTIYQAKGCSQCMNNGYKGRLPIFEVMKMTSALAKLTLERSDAAKLEEVAKSEGMTMLIDDGLRKVILGTTTIEEVLSVAMTYDEETVDNQLKNKADAASQINKEAPEEKE
jgi:general secretion pathway protein E